jgi:Gamma-glutamyl cyclotransferase, AIG2-like
MSTRDIDVFFYGLFMDADALRAKGIHPRNIRAARVSDFALRLGQRAAVVPTVGAEVHGFVMGLSHAEIEALYSDSSVRGYRPEAVLAELADGQKCPALCFNLETPPDLREGNAQYAEALRELGRRLNLPARYIESIQ